MAAPPPRLSVTPGVEIEQAGHSPLKRQILIKLIVQVRPDRRTCGVDPGNACGHFDDVGHAAWLEGYSKCNCFADEDLYIRYRCDLEARLFRLYPVSAGDEVLQLECALCARGDDAFPVGPETVTLALGITAPALSTTRPLIPPLVSVS